jgi:nucleoside-diphosphate-sugar epimerase
MRPSAILPEDAKFALRSPKAPLLTKPCGCLGVAEQPRLKKMRGDGQLRVLLIGGSGFVSGAIARMAVSEGYQVTVVTRGLKPLPSGVTALTADRTIPGALEAALAASSEDFDLVVDCIGYQARDARQDLALFAKRCRHLVFISSDFVFDPDKRQFPQNENNNFFLTDDSYGANKRRCELEFLQSTTDFSHWSIMRPGHIYGPGSHLGCLPEHGRDPHLLGRIRGGTPLRLVGAGKYLQQPIFVDDLARLVLSCPFSPCAGQQIYHCAGPEIVESATYYQILAELLGCPLRIEEVPVLSYRREHPEHKSFLCHRVYDLRKIRMDCLAVPDTALRVGLKIHLDSILNENP